MSDLSILEQLKQQRDSFISQRDQVQSNLNQLIGAIYACELMIKKHEDEALKSQSGEKVNVEAIKQESEQVTQE